MYLKSLIELNLLISTGSTRKCLNALQPSFFIWSLYIRFFFFFSSRRRHTRFKCDWSSDVCSSDLTQNLCGLVAAVPIYNQGIQLSAGDGIERRVRFGADFSFNLEIIKNLVHHAEHLSIMAEQNTFKPHYFIFFHWTISSGYVRFLVM